MKERDKRIVSIALASHNRGKVEEFRRLLSVLTLEIHSLDELGVGDEPDETGDSFAANAVLKAMAAVRATGLPALADDSGLVVEALRGDPGLRSARWAGNITAPERNRRLLERMEGVPERNRGARFVCAIALCTTTGASAVAYGAVTGRIAMTPCGSHGFGYDPIFWLPELGRTFAELQPGEKHRLSHRGRALTGMLPMLRVLLDA